MHFFNSSDFIIVYALTSASKTKVVQTTVGVCLGKRRPLNSNQTHNPNRRPSIDGFLIAKVYLLEILYILLSHFVHHLKINILYYKH